MSAELGASAFSENQASEDFLEQDQNRPRRGKIATRIGALVATTGLVVTANLLIAGEADASTPTCYGDYCSGLYADDAHCDEDATTIADTRIVLHNSGVEVGPVSIGGNDQDVGLLELRYSEKCGTVWARMNTTVDSPIQFLGVEQDGGYEQYRNVAGRSYPAQAQQAFSPMVYGREDSYRAFVYSHHPLGLPEEVGTLWTEPPEN